MAVAAAVGVRAEFTQASLIVLRAKIVHVRGGRLPWGHKDLCTELTARLRLLRSLRLASLALAARGDSAIT